MHECCMIAECVYVCMYVCADVTEHAACVCMYVGMYVRVYVYVDVGINVASCARMLRGPCMCCVHVCVCAYII